MSFMIVSYGGEQSMRFVRGCVFSSFLFFFQAEDGIRDDLVTGVQTCALPIYLVRHLVRHRRQLTPMSNKMSNKMSNTIARVAIFEQVCAAIHYAHQQLVVHRDRKSVV